VVGHHLVGQFVGGKFLELAASPPRDVRVDHRAPNVGIEGGPVVDLAPGQVGLGQRGLHQVLSVGPVAGEHDGHPQQGGSAGEDVVTEGGIAVTGFRFLVIADEAHG
jgi:hypothetical protein